MAYPGMLLSREEASEIATEVERIWSGLDDRSTLILRKRVFSENPLTLAAMGAELDVTRERVRQLERRALESVDMDLRPFASPGLSGLAESFRQTMGLVVPFDDRSIDAWFSKQLHDLPVEVSDVQPLVERILGLQHTVFEGTPFLGDVAGLFQAFEEGAGTSGIIDEEMVERILFEREVQTLLLPSILDASSKFRAFGGCVTLWNRTQVDDAVVILELLGESCQVREIMAELGRDVSERSLTQRLLSDDRVVRVSKKQIGLAKWGLQSYGSITESVARLLAERGGSVDIDEAAETLAQAFELSETSVRTYMEAPMFVVDQGMVRIRRDDEPFINMTNPKRARGIYPHPDGGFSLLIRVDRDGLRGSGRPLTRSLAAAIALEAGSEIRYAHDEGDITFFWSMASFAPSLSSIRSVLVSCGAEIGDLVRIDFPPTGSISIDRLQPAELSGAPSEGLVARITGIDTEPTRFIEELRYAVMAEPGESLLRAISAKNDEVLLQALPDEYLVT